MMFQHYIEILNKHRILIFTLVICLYSVLSSFSYKIEIASSFREFFDDKNTKVEIFDAIETAFNKQDRIVIHIKNNTGSIFNPKTLGLIFDLSNASWSIPHSIRVDSLSNYQHTEVRGDSLSVNFLIEKKDTLNNKKHIKEIQRISEETGNIYGVLVGKDKTFSIISITVNRQDNNKLINAEIYSRHRKASQSI